MASTKRATDSRWFKDITTARLEHEYRTVCDYIQYWDEEAAKENNPISFRGEVFCPRRKAALFRMILEEIGQELESRRNSKSETQIDLRSVKETQE